MDTSSSTVTTLRFTRISIYLLVKVKPILIWKSNKLACLCRYMQLHVSISLTVLFTIIWSIIQKLQSVPAANKKPSLPPLLLPQRSFLERNILETSTETCRNNTLYNSCGHRHLAKFYASKKVGISKNSHNVMHP